MDSTPIRSWSPLREERNRKRHLLIATLLGMVMNAFDPYANADVYVCDLTSSSVLRFDEVTGAAATWPLTPPAKQTRSSVGRINLIALVGAASD